MGETFVQYCEELSSNVLPVRPAAPPPTQAAAPASMAPQNPHTQQRKTERVRKVVGQEHRKAGILENGGQLVLKLRSIAFMKATRLRMKHQ